jgi:hypothetical protein
VDVCKTHSGCNGIIIQNTQGTKLNSFWIVPACKKTTKRIQPFRICRSVICMYKLFTMTKKFIGVCFIAFLVQPSSKKQV